MSVHNIYTIMARSDVNMAKIDKLLAKKRGALKPAPLSTERCCSLSIYLIKQDGTMWTLNSGKPYAQVRETDNRPTSPVYVCMSCKARAGSLRKLEHKEKV